MMGEIRRRNAAAALLLVLWLALPGCSDDIICEDGPGETVPYISARLVEFRGADGDSTFVEVFCTADPLPGLLSATVNGRAIGDVGPAEDPGVLATLEETTLVWQPGTRCSLRVGTEYGIAGASAFVPEPFAVSAPESIALGDTLTVAWAASEHADYYRVSLILGAGTPGEREVAATVDDTVAVFLPSSISVAGPLVGEIWAVSGPFPEDGADGNVKGSGWGFFTAAYRDGASAFDLTVTPRDGSRDAPSGTAVSARRADCRE